MWLIAVVIFDQIVKYIVEATKCNVRIIDNIFNLSYAQNTRWYLWYVSR